MLLQRAVAQRVYGPFLSASEIGRLPSSWPAACVATRYWARPCYVLSGGLVVSIEEVVKCDVCSAAAAIQWSQHESEAWNGAESVDDRRIGI